MKKHLITALLINANCLLASEYTTSEPKLDWSLKEVVSSCYFQNASVIGQGTAAKETYDFLCSTLSMDSNFVKGNIEDSNYIYEYFSRSNTDGSTEIVLLPFKFKTRSMYNYHTIDIHSKLSHDSSDILTRTKTLHCLEELKRIFSGEIRCHLLLKEESITKRPLKPAGTILGRLLNKLFADTLDAGHLNYGCLIANGDTQKLIIGEPASLRVLKRYYQSPVQLKIQAFEGEILIDQKPIGIEVIFRGDQCYNGFDCGRFSLIYLMSALEGQDIRTMSRFSVYNGFKKWIEGDRGLLSFQKDYSLFRLASKQLYEERINRIDTMISDIKTTFEQRRTDILKVKPTSEEEYSTQLSKIQELDREHLEQMRAAVTKATNMISEEEISLIEIEKKLPPIRKSWTASFTTFGRKIVDILMYFLDKQ